MTSPLLSIVIPFLNEAAVLPMLREKFLSVVASLPAWELIFVSDGSTDGSIEFIERWGAENSAVKLVVLTRNFGHQSAVSAGLAFASGDFVGVMDADLQDDPQVLLDMWRTLQAESVDIVYAVRTSREERGFKRFFYYAFYRLYLYLADTPVQTDSGDFCVMSRRAVQMLLQFPEKLRFVRGLRAWLGLPGKAFPVARPRRAAGEAQYSFGKLLKLALSGLTSFSTRPLRVGFVCGALICACAVVAALIYLGLAFFSNTRMAAPGFTTLVVILLFFNGMVFLYLGVLGEYIGQIFMEVKARPAFLVERTLNLPQKDVRHGQV
jgi:glycosyltransferase involved in cell wall biosynthesis